MSTTDSNKVPTLKTPKRYQCLLVMISSPLSKIGDCFMNLFRRLGERLYDLDLVGRPYETKAILNTMPEQPGKTELMQCCLPDADQATGR